MNVFSWDFTTLFFGGAYEHAGVIKQKRRLKVGVFNIG